MQWCGTTTNNQSEVENVKEPVEITANDIVEEVNLEEVLKKEVEVEVEQKEQTTITITTDYGIMEAVLYNNTPEHRDNFIKLAQEWYYNDLLFHRIIEWFMIQWGDPDSRDAAAWASLWRWWPWYQIDAEIGLPHFKGTLAAARTGGPLNPEKKSSGSQFYIVQGTPVSEVMLTQLATQKWITYSAEDKAKYLQVWWTPMLDNDYTVFGEIVVWLDVLDAIAGVEKDWRDRPIEDVKMTVEVK